MEPTLRTEFFKFAFERTQYEHGHLSEAWARLDDKAQATATIAGVFMAAAFAFLQSSAVQLGVSQKWLLSGVVLFLVISIVLAIFSMLVGDVELPPTSARAAEMVADVLRRDPAEFAERYDGLLADTIDPWIKVNAKLRLAVDRKGSKLLHAQKFLLLAAITITVLTAIVLL